MNKINDGFNIAGVHIYPRTALAPLAGITSLPFRLMAKEMGCGLIYTEMISAKALVYESEKTVKMLDSSDSERPLAVQIFGAEPDVMAEAAARVQDMGADIVDINFGCAVRKVMKTGAGVALMRESDRAEQVLKAVRNVLRIPLTIKIRSGWDVSGQQAFRTAKIAEDCGVDALAFHPRTAQQRFGGLANRALIAEMKKKISIPVIGNGDITSAEDAISMIRDTGCDAVMIGRAAMSYPEIFRDVARLLEGESCEALSLSEHFDMIHRYVERLVNYHGEEIACMLLRSRLCFLVKGLPRAVSFRKQMSNISSKEQVLSVLNQFRYSLESRVSELV
jgi:nifR3 family TIM-barrel protein